MSDLAAIRRVYARKVMEIAGVASPGIEAAFATVPREDFAGPGPWQLRGPAGYEATPDADPARLYEDVLIGLLPEKQINNGQPSGHAMWLAAADVRPGEHVVHVGAGTGYYTAILAELTGSTGRVTAIEYDEGLARRAADNLARHANVTVIRGDGVTCPFDPADVIYVNAGVARPGDNWLDRLKEGGRLVVPLTTTGLDAPFPVGAMFCFMREGPAFRVSVISQAAFVSCEGLRESETDRVLAEAFRRGETARVARLAPGPDWPEEQVWLRWPGWTMLLGPAAK